jgi:hypothetical protein
MNTLIRSLPRRRARPRTGVARGRADDVQHAAGALQRVLERLPEELHRHVLERERRAFGQPDERDPVADRRERDGRGEDLGA